MDNNEQTAIELKDFGWVPVFSPIAGLEGKSGDLDGDELEYIRATLFKLGIVQEELIREGGYKYIAESFTKAINLINHLKGRVDGMSESK